MQQQAKNRKRGKKFNLKNKFELFNSYKSNCLPFTSSILKLFVLCNNNIKNDTKTYIENDFRSNHHDNILNM